jgi:hypothetical protein
MNAAQLASFEACDPIHKAIGDWFGIHFGTHKCIIIQREGMDFLHFHKYKDNYPPDYDFKIDLIILDVTNNHWPSEFV